MKAKRVKPPKRCLCRSNKARLTYDVANDEYFVACFHCGREGLRKKDEHQAKISWGLRQLSREAEPAGGNVAT